MLKHGKKENNVTNDGQNNSVHSPNFLQIIDNMIYLDINLIEALGDYF